MTNQPQILSEEAINRLEKMVNENVTIEIARDEGQKIVATIRAKEEELHKSNVVAVALSEIIDNQGQTNKDLQEQLTTSQAKVKELEEKLKQYET